MTPYLILRVQCEAGGCAEQHRRSLTTLRSEPDQGLTLMIWFQDVCWGWPEDDAPYDSVLFHPRLGLDSVQTQKQTCPEHKGNATE